MAKKVPGNWIRLKVGYYTDPKISALPSAEAEMLFVRSLSYAGLERTGGWIPSGIIPALIRISSGKSAHRKLINALLKAGLWMPCNDGRDGYMIVAWDRWQESDTEAAQRKAADAERQRRSRQSRQEAMKTSNVTRDSRMSHASSNAACHSDVTPVDTDTDKDKNNYNYNYTTADAVAVSETSPPPAVEASTDLTLIEPKPKAASKRKTSLPGFDEFWSLYPRKTDKAKALKVFQRIAREKTATFDEIISGLKKQLPDFESREPRYVPHPTTWLNGARWDDEPQAARNPLTTADPKAVLREKWIKQCQDAGYFDEQPPNVIPIWDANYKEIAS